MKMYIRQEYFGSYFRPSAYWICTTGGCSNVVLSGNVASGYANFGFVSELGSCTNNSGVTLTENVAHSG